MAQDRWINITLDASTSKKSDMTEFNHTKKGGASAANDLTISFDSATITSLQLFKSAVFAAIQQAAGMLKP